MGKHQQKEKVRLNNSRHLFLLETFFSHQKDDGFEEKMVGRYKLVKQWNGGTKSWEVAIWPPESIESRQKYISAREELKNQQIHWESLKVT